MFRSAVAAAMARAERFGVIGFVAASEARQRLALRGMGVEERLAGWTPLDLPMEVLTDPETPRARIREAARALAATGGGRDRARLHRPGRACRSGGGCRGAPGDRALRGGGGDGAAGHRPR
jgi:hypothetical protein